MPELTLRDGDLSWLLQTLVASLQPDHEDPETGVSLGVLVRCFPRLGIEHRGIVLDRLRHQNDVCGCPIIAGVYDHLKGLSNGKFQLQ